MAINQKDLRERLCWDQQFDSEYEKRFILKGKKLQNIEKINFTLLLIFKYNILIHILIIYTTISELQLFTFAHIQIY